MMNSIFKYLNRPRTFRNVIDILHNNACREHHLHIFLVNSFSSHGGHHKIKIETHNMKSMNEQTIYLSEEIAKGNELTSTQWENLLKNVIERGRQISSVNITATVIGFCISHNQLKVALSFMKHLTENKKEINTATRSKFLRLCYDTWPQCDENIIIHNFKELSSRLPIMDANTAENSILALSLTSQWRKGLELKETIKLTCTPGMNIYSALIQAAFRNGDEVTGWNLAREAFGNDRKLKPQVYSTWLKQNQEHSPTLEAAEKLLNFLSEHNIILPKQTVEDVKHYMEKAITPPWKGQLTVVKRNGICSSCGDSLQPINLTQDQYETLRNLFFERVVLGRDVFIRSSPSEIEAFQLFVESSRPYDVVVDGLNVAYTAGSASKSHTHTFSKAVRSVVEHFENQGMSVMVLGRKHMLKWPRNDMEYIKRNAKLFLANDLSQDDPLLLYAALSGGRETCFVSRDLMRGHAFKMGEPELMQLFRRWQQWRQYRVAITPATGRIRLTPPLSFLPTTQMKKRSGCTVSWHVPYQEVADDGTVILEVPHQWLCLWNKT